MEFVELDCTTIDKVAFDNTYGIVVKFKTKENIYCFPSAPKRAYEKLISVTQPEAFFARAINGRYPYKILEE